MSDLILNVRKTSWRSNSDTLSAIREQVFIIEQRVPRELEWDGLDPGALHVLAEGSDRQPIGTGRLLASGQIGRMAVLEAWRRAGVGSAILTRIIELAPGFTTAPLFLNAQVGAVEFYHRHGFRVIGPKFSEAGIMHNRMERFS